MAVNESEGENGVKMLIEVSANQQSKAASIMKMPANWRHQRAIGAQTSGDSGCCWRIMARQQRKRAAASLSHRYRPARIAPWHGAARLAASRAQRALRRVAAISLAIIGGSWLISAGYLWQSISAVAASWRPLARNASSVRNQLCSHAACSISWRLAARHRFAGIANCGICWQQHGKRSSRFRAWQRGMGGNVMKTTWRLAHRK
jgi:hypothetical protein